MHLWPLPRRPYAVLLNQASKIGDRRASLAALAGQRCMHFNIFRSIDLLWGVPVGSSMFEPSCIHRRRQSSVVGVAFEALRILGVVQSKTRRPIPQRLLVPLPQEPEEDA